MLDPLSLRYFEQLDRLKALADFAQPAPALDDSYKERLPVCSPPSASSRQWRAGLRTALRIVRRLADRALREGFVLTPGLAEGLAVYEKQEESLRLYFPELLGQHRFGA